MDDLVQAASTGNISDLERYIDQGNTREALREAIDARQMQAVRFLLPHVGLNHLTHVLADAKRRGDTFVAQIISTFLANPTKPLVVASPDALQASCDLSVEEFDAYTIDWDSSIGEGSYGHVYAGTHHPDETRVAVKVMLNAKLQPADIPRIRQECDIVSRLDHPSIIRIYGGYHDHVAWYWILPLMTGGDLQRIIDQQGPLPLDACLLVFRQLSGAVAHCHERNIVHRDIKPENVLVANSHRVVLSDFGLSSYQLPGERLVPDSGTPLYVSPEIVWGELYDGRAADVWALGVTFYQLALGYPPFDEPELEHKIAEAALTLPPDLAKNPLEPLLTWMLQKEWRRRPTAWDVWMSLESRE